MGLKLGPSYLSADEGNSDGRLKQLKLQTSIVRQVAPKVIQDASNQMYEDSNNEEPCDYSLILK